MPQHERPDSKPFLERTFEERRPFGYHLLHGAFIAAGAAGVEIAIGMPGKPHYAALAGFQTYGVMVVEALIGSNKHCDALEADRQEDEQRRQDSGQQR